MANAETSFGLRPVGLVGSGTNSTGVTQYEIASNNTNAIFNGALVIPLAGGVIDQAGDTAGPHLASHRPSAMLQLAVAGHREGARLCFPHRRCLPFHPRVGLPSPGSLAGTDLGGAHSDALCRYRHPSRRPWFHSPLPHQVAPSATVVRPPR